MMLFLDASALVARYFGGAGSRRVRRLLQEEQNEGVAISSISVVTFSVLLRDLKADGVAEDRLFLVGKAFQEDLTEMVQLEVDPCLPGAAMLAIRHELRMEPAIQLAAALRLEDRLAWNAKALPRPLVRMVTLDSGLGRAARAERLDTHIEWTTAR